jgi:hypothetical protein
VGRSVHFSREGEAEEIPAENREEGRNFWKFRGFPGCESVGRNVATGEVKYRRREMSAAGGDVEIHLRRGKVERWLAVDSLHK